LNRNKEYWIGKLHLNPHPEGGFFGETYRSDEEIEKSALPERYGGNRSFSTQIYFMLVSGNFSAFHKVNSDETWHFYDGSPVLLHCLHPGKGVITTTLGLEDGAEPQFTITRGVWFAAEVADGGDFSLVGCSVAPGFDFNDFQLAEKDILYSQFPLEIVKRLCR